MRYGSAMKKAKGSPSPLGERVRTRRQALSMTAKTLAREAGVSTSYISQLERGWQRDPSLPTLRRLAGALAMDMHALMGAGPGAAGPPSVPPSLQELADAERLPEETVAMLAGINVEGRQPASSEDWLFLLLAVRHVCGAAG
jgi:transcriptional regulator with XRE-family HTH domain